MERHPNEALMTKADRINAELFKTVMGPEYIARVTEKLGITDVPGLLVALDLVHGIQSSAVEHSGNHHMIRAYGVISAGLRFLADEIESKGK